MLHSGLKQRVDDGRSSGSARFVQINVILTAQQSFQINKARVRPSGTPAMAKKSQPRTDGLPAPQAEVI
jgi:hypothetical protein